jgi:hypothetical protein
MITPEILGEERLNQFRAWDEARAGNLRYDPPELVGVLTLLVEYEARRFIAHFIEKLNFKAEF